MTSGLLQTYKFLACLVDFSFYAGTTISELFAFCNTNWKSHFFKLKNTKKKFTVGVKTDS